MKDLSQYYEKTLHFGTEKAAFLYLRNNVSTVLYLLIRGWEYSNIRKYLTEDKEINLILTEKQIKCSVYDIALTEKIEEENIELKQKIFYKKLLKD
jgi:hypothetical protein